VPGGDIGGVSPEAIQDPERRKKYEAALRANRRKRERSVEQHRIRWLRDRYLPRMKEAIADAYSIQPVKSSDLDVLKAYLRIYVGEPKLRSELFQMARAAAEGK
jgi:hypothetical protein